MIIKLVDYIEKEIRCTNTEGDCAQLSALHFDIHKSNTQRAMLFVFEGRNIFPSYVVKYSKNREYEKHLYDEFNNYSLIYNMLSQKIKSYMAKPICTYNKGSTLAIIEEGVPGESIASLIRQNASLKKMDLIKAAFDFLVSFQAETKRKCDFEDYRIHEFIDRPLSLFCETFHIRSGERCMIKRVRDDVVDYLIDKSVLVSCHGDYWLNNILAYNSNIYIIDWTFCRKEYLLFWDYCSLIYNTKFKSRKMNYEFEELSRYYLRKIDMYPDVESKVRFIYFAIRSVWNKYYHGIENEWDYQWKIRFDKEFSNYKW